MRTLNRFFARLANLFGPARSRADRDLAREIAAHLALLQEEYERRGLSPEAARLAARRAYGGVEQATQLHREARSFPWIEQFAQDLRYAARQLRRSPGFATVAILTLALGIGANTAIFSLTDQVLLRLLPVRHPHELVILRSTETKSGRVAADYNPQNSFSYPMYKNLRDRNDVFSGLLASFPVHVSVVGPGHSEIAHGELVSGNYFNVLGVRPVVGRLFSSADETAQGANPVAVLNYAYWAGHFGGDPSVLHQTLDINGYPFTVVGVAQPGFNAIQAGAKPDLYVPITMKPQITPGWNGLTNASDYFLPLMGRLKPGITQARAAASLQPLFHSLLEAEIPEETSKWNMGYADQARFLAGTIELSPGAQGRQVLQHKAETPLLFLSAMVGLVLLIACANLACLLLARGESRQHEVALRMALGASPGRVIRQLLTESMLLAAAGGAAGLFVAWAALAGMVAVMPAESGTAGLTAQLDLPFFGIAAAAALFSGLCCGLFPALRAARISLQSASKGGAANTTGGSSSIRLRKSLIVAQVAMTAVLLVAAGFCDQSLIHIEHVDLGMDVSHVVQFFFLPGLSRYSAPQTIALFHNLRDTLSHLPGVASVSLGEHAVLAGDEETDAMGYEGYTPRHDEDMGASANHIAPAFFSTLGIPLLRGREFREGDSSSSPQVAIVNESVVRKYFAGRDPIGLHIGFGGEVPRIRIVGVVADSRQVNPRSATHPFIYFPYTQDPVVFGAAFYVRTSLPPDAAMVMLQKAVARLAPDVPAAYFQTLAAQIDDTVSSDRLIAFFTVGLGLLAALIASVGLYGVMAYIVARRTREIGIRMALGALPRNLAAAILWQAGRLALIGIVIGMAAAIPIAHLIRAQLFGVQQAGPLIFVLSGALLIAVAVVASYVPARRATRIDPVTAIRCE